MQYSLFETNGGIQFYYDNVNNQLLEVDGIPFTPGMLPTADELEFAKNNYSTTAKSNQPTAIRLLLGHACNYSCTYCLQKDIGNPSERPKNIMINDLFKNVRNNLDLSNLQRVELWGGEPFLYWKDMIELMKFFDSENMSFGITTNGSALRSKHAEFFSTLKAHVSVTISHDAKMQSALRGHDPLDTLSVVETLQQFNHLLNVNYGFLCSLTNTNFNLFEINDFFRDKILSNNLKCNSLSFSLGRTYQTETKFEPSESLGCNIITKDTSGKQLPKSESKTHVIHGENLELFRELLAEYLEQHYLQFVDSYVDGYPTIYTKSAKETPLLNCDIFESALPYSVTEYMSKTLNGGPILEKTNCGADMADIISMDIDGNVRTCPHSGKEHVFGHLKSIKSIEIKSLKLDKGSHCGSCVVNKLCRSSCPLDLPDETFMTNCRVEKVWYSEIQKSAFRFLLNDHVKMISTSLSAIDNQEESI